MLALLAVFPQDALFTIGNDAVSPPLFLLALHAVLRLRSGDAGALAHAAAGAAAAGAFLAKFTNAAVLPVSALLWLVASRERRAAGGRTPPAAALAFTLSLAAPVSLWLGWNAIVVGDATGHPGTAGWTLKGASAWLDHPITGWEGARHFVGETTASFWRGELVWHGQRLASPLADAFYVATSLVFVLLATLRLLLAGGGLPARGASSRRPPPCPSRSA